MDGKLQLEKTSASASKVLADLTSKREATAGTLAALVGERASLVRDLAAGKPVGSELAKLEARRSGAVALLEGYDLTTADAQAAVEAARDELAPLLAAEATAARLAAAEVARQEAEAAAGTVREAVRALAEAHGQFALKLARLVSLDLGRPAP